MTGVLGPARACSPGLRLDHLAHRAGRGAGTTMACAEAVCALVQTYPIVNLIGATIADLPDNNSLVRAIRHSLSSFCRRDERRPCFLLMPPLFSP